jgi:hypothetical protein
MHTGFWWRNQSERDPLEDLGVEGRIVIILTIKCLQEVGWRYGLDLSGSG